MWRACILSLLFATLGPFVVSAQESSSSGAEAVPSGLGRALVMKEFRAMDVPEDRAGADRMLAAAVEAETALRLGYTYQEVRARLRRRLRLEFSVGIREGERMSARLFTAERRRTAGGQGVGRPMGLGARTAPEKGKRER